MWQLAVKSRHYHLVPHGSDYSSSSSGSSRSMLHLQSDTAARTPAAGRDWVAVQLNMCGAARREGLARSFTGCKDKSDRVVTLLAKAAGD
jgi:hypothetical protein